MVDYRESALIAAADMQSSFDDDFRRAWKSPD